MIRSIILLLLALGSLSAAQGADQTILARVTVYWRGEGQLRASWKGARLHDGHCAVDPRKIPYGSKVLFPDGPCLAVDTGPAVVSRKAARLSGHSEAQRSALVIDRFFESKKEAMAWTATHPHFMTVRVCSPDSKPSRMKKSRALTDIVEVAATKASDWSISAKQWTDLKATIGCLLSAVASVEDQAAASLAVAN